MVNSMPKGCGKACAFSAGPEDHRTPLGIIPSEILPSISLLAALTNFPIGSHVHMQHVPTSLTVPKGLLQVLP